MNNGWLGKIQWNIIIWKKYFYSRLNIEDITDAYNTHWKTVWKDFKTKKIGEYYDLHVQSDTLLLADAFENFQIAGLEIYEINPTCFRAAPELT